MVGIFCATVTGLRSVATSVLKREHERIFFFMFVQISLYLIKIHGQSFLDTSWNDFKAYFKMILRLILAI